MRLQGILLSVGGAGVGGGVDDGNGGVGVGCWVLVVMLVTLLVFVGGVGGGGHKYLQVSVVVHFVVCFAHIVTRPSSPVRKEKWT